MTFELKAALRAAAVACAVFYGFAIEEADAGSAKSYTGIASWYGSQHHGRKTASGERFNMNAMTAAHRTLPFGTKVRVTNRRNGRSVVLTINDRGPYAGKRIIDLSKAAASAVGMIGSGTAPVTIDVLG